MDKELTTVIDKVAMEEFLNKPIIKQQTVWCNDMSIGNKPSIDVICSKHTVQQSSGDIVYRDAIVAVAYTKITDNRKRKFIYYLSELELELDQELNIKLFTKIRDTAQGRVFRGEITIISWFVPIRNEIGNLSKDYLYTKGKLDEYDRKILLLKNAEKYKYVKLDETT